MLADTTSTSLLSSSKLLSLACHHQITLQYFTPLHTAQHPHLVAEGPVLDGPDLVVGEVEMVESFIELESVTDRGDPGAVDDEAGDVGVEGDGEDGEGGVSAGHTKLVVVTVTA